MSTKLNDGEKHFLRLIVKGQRDDGWAPVSKPVYPLIKAMPPELIEHRPDGDEGRGLARLTPEGQSILDAMDWL